MKADLHIHSYHSDGKYSPAEIVFYAAQSHLDVIALTDHDTIDGLADAREACRKHPSLTLIPGVELSTYQEADELHILGYGIDPAHPALTALLMETGIKRQARLRRVLLNWRDARPAPAIAPADRQLIEEFAAAYPPHIALEEALVYPAARTAVTAEQLARIGEEMAARRRA